MAEGDRGAPPPHHPPLATRVRGRYPGGLAASRSLGSRGARRVGWARGVGAALPLGKAGEGSASDEPDAARGGSAADDEAAIHTDDEAAIDTDDEPAIDYVV